MARGCKCYEDEMSFDFSQRHTQRLQENAARDQLERHERDVLNASARSLASKINMFVELQMLKATRAVAESNVVTIERNTDKLKLTVLSPNIFAAKEIASSVVGARPDQLDREIQRQDLTDGEMMDLVLDWLHEKVG